MTRIPLELSPGLISDETVYSTPGWYADGSNVRFRYGKPETIGGWAAFQADTLTGVCRSALAWIDNFSQTNVAFGTHSALHVNKGGVLYDITPSGLGAGDIDAVTYVGGWGGGGWGMGGWGIGGTQVYPRTWSLANWGESLMASPSGGGIYWWQNSPTTVAAVLSGAPTSVNRMTVAPTRQVIAFGCAEEVSGVYNPMCIRGSDIAVPTDWTVGSADNAFEEILPGGGFIVEGKVFGDGMLVWTDTALFLGTYVGAATQTWRFDQIASGCGLASPQGAVIVNQTAYWVTPDLQFYTYQYGGTPVPIPCSIRRDFTDNIDGTQATKMVAATLSEFQEVWWFYPDARDGDENSRYIAVCTMDNTWFRGILARTSFIDSGSLAYPLGVDYAGQAYSHENGNDANGSALSWFIETGGQYVGSGERKVLLRGIWPDFEAQQGVISVTVKVRDYPQGPVTTKGPYILGPATLKKDFMVQGRIAAVRLSGEADPTFMRLGKPSFDTVLTGER